MYSSNALVIVWGAVWVVVIVCAIYLTPLKWFNIIEPGIRSIDPAAFQKDFVANPSAFLFVDVRPENTYNAFHAKGSVNMPVDTLYDERRSLPTSGREIVLIGSANRASGVGFSYLQHFGFFNIARIEGGIEAWTLKGLPVEGSQALDTQ